MSYLVLKGDSYNRKVVLTNTCNKPRIACKNGTVTSYIPVNAGGGGTKNLRISNSYIDIRQINTYNTTTMTVNNYIVSTTRTEPRTQQYSSTYWTYGTSTESGFNDQNTITTSTYGGPLPQSFSNSTYINTGPPGHYYISVSQLTVYTLCATGYGGRIGGSPYAPVAVTGKYFLMYYNSIAPANIRSVSYYTQTTGYNYYTTYTSQYEIANTTLTSYY